LNIAIVTNIKAPYRKLQIEEFCKITNISNMYYTNKNIDVKWNVEPINGVNEKILQGFRLFKKYGYFNLGLVDIVRNNNVIIIGGYEQPTYILLSFLCRFYKKPYVIIFDGISPKKINEAENPVKFLLKNLVVKHASAIFGNGTVAKLYFSKKFGYLFSPLLGLEKNIQYVIVIITEETGGYSKWLKSDTVQNSLNR